MLDSYNNSVKCKKRKEDEYEKWKKFIAMGLAVSMIVPSCIPQTLWASEFSAGSVESAADVFEDGAEYETGSESGNKISDENNSGDEFGTGELKDQEPEQSETEDSVNAGQSAEGYNILLYSDGKLEKTYVIPYADVDTAKVPEALKGKTGYIFKEWNTKEDGTGETYKPGDSIKKLLETADMAKQAQETSERTEAGEEIKPEKDVMQEENDVAQTDSASWEEKLIRQKCRYQTQKMMEQVRIYLQIRLLQQEIQQQ